MDADVVIVGGGIGGAVLGNLLARRGKRAIVLEPTPLRPQLFSSLPRVPSRAFVRDSAKQEP